ncbi:S-ribosylhomocysteine lyase [Microbacterium oryzae]|nr:S-ribosylhomocysteine lyase [Microbacterium oryzae]
MVTEAPRMNVESFNLDHRIVSAPYVRLANRKQLPAGDVIVKYDVRFAQPNRAHLEMPTVHSIEHLFAEKSRNHSDRVIDFSPMGCQTGFYLILQGEPAYDEVLALIEATLTDILDATEVPAANETQCGWGANHTLEGAQSAVRAFLAERDQWSTVYAA